MIWSHHSIMLFCYIEKKILEYNSKSKWHLLPESSSSSKFPVSVLCQYVSFLYFFHEHLCSENVYICTFALVWAHMCVLGAHLFMYACLWGLRLMLVSSSIPPPHYSLRQGLSIKPNVAGLFWRSRSAFQGLNYKWAATSTLSSQSSLILSWSSYVGGGTQQPFIIRLCHEWFMTVKNLCTSWYLFYFTYHSAFTTAHNYF